MIAIVTPHHAAKVPTERVKQLLDRWILECGGHSNGGCDVLAARLSAAGVYSNEVAALRRISSIRKLEWATVEVAVLDKLLVAMDEEWRFEELTRGCVCSGCGTHYTNRTRGCDQCTARHHWRKRRGKGKYQPLRCAQCNCKVDQRTRGCHACSNRHNARREKGKPFKRSRAPKRCRGCGGLFEQRNPNCETCKHRMWKRGQESRKRETRTDLRRAA